jgi:hypothetical protein
MPMIGNPPPLSGLQKRRCHTPHPSSCQKYPRRRHPKPTTHPAIVRVEPRRRNRLCPDLCCTCDMHGPCIDCAGSVHRPYQRSHRLTCPAATAR